MHFSIFVGVRDVQDLTFEFVRRNIYSDDSVVFGKVNTTL